MSPAEKDIIFDSTYLYYYDTENDLPKSMSIDDEITPPSDPSPTIAWTTLPSPPRLTTMTLSPVIPLTVPSDKLKRKEGPSTSTLKSAKLSQWFSPVSADVAQRDRERLVEEHRRVLEERKDEEAAAEEWRKKRNTENARIRQQNLRDRKKEADIEAGIRDEDGRIIKSTQHIPAAPLPLTSSAVPLRVAEASRPNRTLKEEVCQQRGTVGRPRMVEYKPAVLVNYYNPLIWVHIARVGAYC